MDYSETINELLDTSGYLISNIKPSDWAEQNRIMSTDVSPFPGPFSFKKTPYLREVLDCVAPDHPAHTIVTMKGAQIGFSTGVIENAIGHIIAHNPGNILFLTGHADLAEEAMSGKIDNMIDSCGLRPLIRPNVLRKRNQRTGDTNKAKEFPGGSLVSGSAGNHKLLRQRSVRFGFIDDFDAVKKSSKESGSTTGMIEQRFAGYADKRKIYYISTPEVDQTSNIKPLYLLGDQRKYYVPCPCCGDYIVLEWTVEKDKEIYGISYKRAENGKYIEGSAGYICQECGEFFTDKHKYEMNLAGEWRATAEPSEVGYYSYHISALYAPPGMYDWEHYIRQYVRANPVGLPQKIKQMQTFVNLVLGQTFEEIGEAPKANALQRNTREYSIGEVPEEMSIKDGNGRIVLITCAADLNGKLEDARLDYEIVGWSETGSSYSIIHGSIGTFIPNESQKKNKKDRKRWTYMINDNGNVWDKFTEILETVYETDTGRKMPIGITGLDTGNTYQGNAYAYLEKQHKFLLVGIKGKDRDKFRRYGVDTKVFRLAQERNDLYLAEVNQIKDDLAEIMKLHWRAGNDNDQPVGFMNFPTPSGGKYMYNNYFSHFESEHRIIDKNKDGDGFAARWTKRNSAAQNHLWDCRVYNIALKDIWVHLFGKMAEEKEFTWKDYVDSVIGSGE